jgi:F0F1-type ATP synthase delta subunit
MKYKTKDYAKALAQIISESKNLNEKKVIQGFLKLLEKQGDLNRAKEIINYTEALLAKKNGKKIVTFQTARKMSPNQREQFSKFIKKGDIVQEKIVPELIAGIRIIVDGEKQLDQSFAKKINSLI